MPCHAVDFAIRLDFDHLNAGFDRFPNSLDDGRPIVQILVSYLEGHAKLADPTILGSGEELFEFGFFGDRQVLKNASPLVVDHEYGQVAFE